MGSRLSSREGVGGSEIKRGRERERDRGREEARRKAVRLRAMKRLFEAVIEQACDRWRYMTSMRGSAGETARSIEQ